MKEKLFDSLHMSQDYLVQFLLVLPEEQFQKDLPILKPVLGSNDIKIFGCTAEYMERRVKMWINGIIVQVGQEGVKVSNEVIFKEIKTILTRWRENIVQELLDADARARALIQGMTKKAIAHREVDMWNALFGEIPKVSGARFVSWFAEILKGAIRGLKWIKGNVVDLLKTLAPLLQALSPLFETEEVKAVLESELKDLKGKERLLRFLTIDSEV